MCIALLTTAHPDYALIAIDNRDEFILRPTSRPHWWTTDIVRQDKDGSDATTTTTTTTEDGPSSPGVQHVLSSRDLLRTEQGTWLGITRAGHLAVLTNYRELQHGTGAPSVSGARSRGAVVTNWLGAPPSQSVGGFVEAMIANGGTQGVGGFSLICGKLRRKRRREGEGAAANMAMEPLAILSNKAARPDEIPWLCEGRGETVGLSNAAFDSPQEWPKVAKGKALLRELVAKAAAEEGLGEDALRERLFGLLSCDELPTEPGMAFEDYFQVLQESIFIPPVGNQEHKDAMARAQANGGMGGPADPALRAAVDGSQRPDPQAQGFSTGMYGTQRQTVLLVDWEGNVTYTERALFDESGNVVEKGKGDVTFRFAIDGWDESG